MDQHILAKGFLDLDARSRARLIDIGDGLASGREAIADAWRAAFLEATRQTAPISDGDAAALIHTLLDLFFAHVPSGDFEGYYRAIAAKGNECQAADLPQGLLMLAIHLLEQVALPYLTASYVKHADLESALDAIDRLCDNAIAVVASSYFDTTVAELRALQQVTDTALSTLDLDQMLHSLLLRLVDAISGDAAGVLLRDEATGDLYARGYVGLAGSEVEAYAAKPGVGVAGRAVVAGRAIEVSDAQSDPMVLDPNMKSAGIKALVCVPLKLGSRIIGALYVGRRLPRPFRAREIQLLELLGERVAAAVEHAQLYQRTARMLRQTAALQRVNSSITAKMALPQVLETVIDGVVEVFGANRVAIFLHDRQTGNLNCPAFRGLSEEFVRAVKDRYRESAEGKALLTGTHFYSLDVRHDHALDPLRPEIDFERVRTILILPFGHASETPGALCLYHDDVRRYEDEERGLAQTFADQAAIAIANATLYREIRERAVELDRANAELQILDRMKADFLAVISHELRTPLTAVLGYTDLLLRGARGELAERQLADLKTIRSNGHRLLSLINDLIDFSSLEAGRSRVTGHSIQLTRLLPRVLRSFGPLAATRSIVLHVELPPTLPSVMGEAGAVEKTVSQLLSNAIKFTPPGGEVTVSAIESDGPCLLHRGVATQQCLATANGSKRCVVVAVADNGIGIPEEQLSRIWDHFYQVDSSSARRFGGTGLGLAIVKRLVGMLGGCVWAESEGIAGKGSTFSFALPMVASHHAQKVS